MEAWRDSGDAGWRRRGDHNFSSTPANFIDQHLSTNLKALQVQSPSTFTSADSLPNPQTEQFPASFASPVSPAWQRRSPAHARLYLFPLRQRHPHHLAAARLCSVSSAAVVPTHRRRKVASREGFGCGRIGLMAAAAAAGEDLRHMGPAARVEEVEEVDNAAAEEGLGGDDDDEILRFMDSVDGYLLLMESLSSALRKGWIDLSSARHSMGASRVSSTLFDHKEQSAATKLQVVYSADTQSSESNPHFALSKWCLQEESNSDDVVSVQDSTKPILRYRGSATTPGDGSNELNATSAKSSTGVGTSSHVQRARSKALSVFGALVSPKLRTAQVSFETALELIVELANSRSTMLSSFSQIKREA